MIGKNLFKRIGIGVAIVVVLGVIGWFAASESGLLSSVPEELVAVEVRAYEGKPLSSVNDFRENSIKGPQHVDIAGYQLEITGLVENPVSYGYEEVIDQFQH